MRCIHFGLEWGTCAEGKCTVIDLVLYLLYNSIEKVSGSFFLFTNQSFSQEMQDGGR